MSKNEKSVNAEYAKIGIDYVKRTCDDFGPRFSCTENEKGAAEQLSRELDEFCDKTFLDKFTAIPNLYPRGFILIAGVLTILGTPFLFFRSPISIIAAVLPLFGLFVVWATFFLMKEWFGFLFEKGTSHNATGRIFPRDAQGDRKSV